MKYFPHLLTFVALILVATAVEAFTAPTQSPPDGNASAPVTIGTSQTVSGTKTFSTQGLFPFLVASSNANTVQNLDADKLDAYDAADLLAGAGGTGADYSTGSWTLLGVGNTKLGTNYGSETVSVGTLPGGTKEILWAIGGMIFQSEVTLFPAEAGFFSTPSSQIEWDDTTTTAVVGSFNVVDVGSMLIKFGPTASGVTKTTEIVSTAHCAVPDHTCGQSKTVGPLKLLVNPGTREVLFTASNYWRYSDGPYEPDGHYEDREARHDAAAAVFYR
jgi:hypothetical protein